MHFNLFQIQKMKATCMIMCTVGVILLLNAAGSITKYTNRPLNGQFCNGNFYENVTDMSQHWCLHRCLSNSQCATLSYNPVGYYCLLGYEACSSATLHPEFMLMVFRELEQLDCISCVPRDDASTTDRLLTTTVGPPYLLGLWREGNNQMPGFAPSILVATDMKLKRSEMDKGIWRSGVAFTNMV